MSTAAERLKEALLGLGFSPYESRCYIGLLGSGPQTGYGVAKVTGVPQPKVYEALRKLVHKGAAVQLDGEPTLFRAVAPEQLLASLAGDFTVLVKSAEVAVQELEKERPDLGHGQREVANSLASRDEVLDAARLLIEQAGRRVYLSASPAELEGLEPSLVSAVAREVDVIVLDFARKPVAHHGMRVFRHASTENSVYRHHQARHVALVTDSAAAINAISVEGEEWEGVRSSNGAIIAAVKGMIKHDIDLQQIYVDFGEMLVKTYGPGLQKLEAYRREDAAVGAPAERAAV